MEPMPLSYNLAVLKEWAEKSGIPFQGTPQAKNTRPYDGRSPCMRCNTCEICPTGARYSPDFTFKQLLAAKKIELHDRHSGATTRASQRTARRDRSRAGVKRNGGGSGRIPGEDLRARVRLRLVAASAAALGMRRTVPAWSAATWPATRSSARRSSSTPGCIPE